MKKDEVLEVEVVDSTVKTIEFTRPVVFDGVTHNKIDLDLNALNGHAIEAAEIQYTTENPKIATQTPLKEMSKGYLAIVAAKAAKKPVEFIRQLPAADYSKVTTAVMVFLMTGE